MKRLLCLGVSVWALSAGTALAQTAQSDGGASAAAPAQVSIDEVIVTAQKRSENIQSVPITMTAVGGERMEALGVRNTDALQNIAPGLTIAAVGSGFVSYTYVRGAGTNQIDIGADPSVAYFIDEIYIGGTAGLQLDLFDIDHAEVLKGPQGTLFGRNAASGAISIVTKRPSGTQEGYINLEGGNYDTFVGHMGLTGPIEGTPLRYRAGVSYKRHGGYTDNLAPGGEDPGKMDALSGRLQLEWVGDDATFLLSGDALRGRNGQTNQFFSTANKAGLLNAAAAALYPMPGESFYKHYYPRDGFENQDAHGLSGRLEWTTPVGELTSITASRYNRFTRVQEYTPGVNGYQINTDEKDRFFSQEIRLASPNSGRFRWLAGLYYYHANQILNAFAVAGPAFASPVIANTTRNDLSHIKTKSYAAFGQASFDITDQLTAIAGLRYTSDKKEDDRRVSSTNALSPQNYAVDPKKTWHALTPAFTLQYTFDPDAMVYASYKRGFKSGGFQPLLPATAAVAAVPFDPEFVNSYELGAKTSWFDRRLTFNISGFVSKIKDQQVSITGAGLLIVTNNAGATTTKGVDITLQARPTPNLRFGVDATYQHARFDRYDTIVGGVPKSLAGNQQLRSPDFSAALNATYDIPLADGSRISLMADYNYRTKQFFDANNATTPGIYQPAYGLANARVSYKTANGAIEVAGWVKNLADKKYARNIIVIGPTGLRNPGDPLTVGASVNLRY
jgi:iron complex outermembrane receptor protein